MDATIGNPEIIARAPLIKSLVDRFFKLGKAGETHADDSWRALGLDTNKRTLFGQALQSLLGVIDQTVEELELEELHGMININNKYVTYQMAVPLTQSKVIEFMLPIIETYQQFSMGLVIMPRDTILFDINETVLDLSSLKPKFKAAFGDEAVTATRLRSFY